MSFRPSLELAVRNYFRNFSSCVVVGNQSSVFNPQNRVASVQHRSTELTSEREIENLAHSCLLHQLSLQSLAELECCQQTTCALLPRLKPDLLDSYGDFKPAYEVD
jgi:hypothetical protein